MPHFLRKPDYKHSTPSLPLQDKTQSNNTKAADHNPSLHRRFRRFVFFSSALYLQNGERLPPRQAQSQLRSGTNAGRTSTQAVFPWLYF